MRGFTVCLARLNNWKKETLQKKKTSTLEKQPAFCAGCLFWRDLIRCTLDVPIEKLVCKARANGRNIVGQQLPTSLRPFVHPVGCCCAKFDTDQTFEHSTPNISFVPWWPRRSATTLDPFAQLFQHRWGHADALHMVSTVLWVVSFPRSTVGTSMELLHPFTQHCQHGRSNSYHCWSNNVGSCCVRFRLA